MASEQHYEGRETVRAFLHPAEFTDEQIDEAARKLGWPTKAPHPFLVAEKLDRAVHS